MTTTTPCPTVMLSDNCHQALRFNTGGTAGAGPSHLLPAFAEAMTSDRVRNHVDLMVGPLFGGTSVVIVYTYPYGSDTHSAFALGDRAEQVAVVPPDPPVGGLNEIATPDAPTSPQRAAQGLRGLVEMPVEDLARMIGVRRRQFYNLLNGEASSPQTEVRLQRVAEHVERIDAALGSGPRELRSALLAPYGPGGTSFFEAAVADDANLLPACSEALIERITAGRRRFPSRAVPRRRIGAEGRRAAREKVADLPSAHEGEDESGGRH